MRNLRSRYSRNKYGSILNTHIQQNLREYAIAGIIFIIGIMIGIVFVNNLTDGQNLQISAYINDSVSQLKESKNSNTVLIIKESIKDNSLLVLLLWIMGSTVIGLLMVYLIICFKGFCFGYSLSSIICTLGVGKGCLFFFFTMFFKSLIVIPCVVALAVSGMRLYKSIMQDRRKENIKLEVLRHSATSILILIILVISSILSSYITNNIFKYFVKYI